MLDALYDTRRSQRPVAAAVFLGLCVAVSVPAFFLPEFRDAVSGVTPREHPWQVFTAVFVHGWPGFPGVLHLLLNAVLIVECGFPCERLLGTPRFIVLCAAAVAAVAWTMSVTEGVNGSSMVIWAWGPSLFVALRAAGRGGGDDGDARRRLAGVLVIMYVVVTLAMPVLPYAAGWRGNVLFALLAANTYHLIATALGAGFAIAWKKHIDDRLESFRRREG